MEHIDFNRRKVREREVEGERKGCKKNHTGSGSGSETSLKVGIRIRKKSFRIHNPVYGTQCRSKL
jgi:hypothetical protein